MKTRTLILFVLALAGLLAALVDRPRVRLEQPRGGVASSEPTLLSLLQAGRAVMFVGAHPDDESAAGPLLARTAEQSKTIVVCFTKGEGGRNRTGQERDAALGKIRARELAAACAVLGVEHRILGFRNEAPSLSDGSVNPENARETPELVIARWQKSGTDPNGELVKAIRQWQPDIILTFDTEQGFTGHKEHRAAGLLATAAFGESADAKKFPGQLKAGLKVWQAQRLYYVVNRHPEKISRSLARIDGKRIAEVIDATERSLKRDKTYLAIALESVARHGSQFGKDQLRMLPEALSETALVLAREHPLVAEKP